MYRLWDNNDQALCNFYPKTSEWFAHVKPHWAPRRKANVPRAGWRCSTVTAPGKEAAQRLRDKGRTFLRVWMQTTSPVSSMSPYNDYLLASKATHSHCSCSYRLFTHHWKCHNHLLARVVVGLNGWGSAATDAEAKGSFPTEFNRSWVGMRTATSSFQNRVVTEQCHGR